MKGNIRKKEMGERKGEKRKKTTVGEGWKVEWGQGRKD